MFLCHDSMSLVLINFRRVTRPCRLSRVAMTWVQLSLLQRPPKQLNKSPFKSIDLHVHRYTFRCSTSVKQKKRRGERGRESKEGWRRRCKSTVHVRYYLGLGRSKSAVLPYSLSPFFFFIFPLFFAVRLSLSLFRVTCPLFSPPPHALPTNLLQSCHRVNQERQSNFHLVSS